MESGIGRLLAVGMVAIGLVLGDSAWAVMDPPQKPAAKIDMKKVERGRYIARIAGCNDCHTPGYLLSDGKTPESQWLTGDHFGWRGPWGTTYGANLRIYLSGMSEGKWVSAAQTLKRRPTMPWFNLNTMKAEDLKAMYHFIKYLGPVGEPGPVYVPPGQEPKTPYALFPSPPK